MPSRVQLAQIGIGEPDIAVVGAIHGDEPCGEHAVRTIREAAPDVERPVLLIVANEEATERGVRFVDVDLNRSFPGDPDSERHEERLAARLTREIADCETLSLHSTQSYGGTFALVHEVDAFVRSICRHLSIDAVVETHAVEGGRIFSAVPRTIEVECGFQGTETAAENAVRLTREFLGATGALPDERIAARTDLPVFRLRGRIQKTPASVYEVFVDNFEEVAAGEVVASVDDEDVVADEPFHPVLVSPEGYDEVFGYRAELVGTLETAEDE